MRFFREEVLSLLADEEAKCSLVRSDQVNRFVYGFQKATIRLHSFLSNLALQVKNLYLKEFYFQLRFLFGHSYFSPFSLSARYYCRIACAFDFFRFLFQEMLQSSNHSMILVGKADNARSLRNLASTKLY